MAKKDTDNFDFEVEGENKGKFNLNLDFIKNLTKKQKGIILAALVGIVLVIAIVVTCIIIGVNGGFSGGATENGGTDGGSSSADTDGDGEPDEVPENIIKFEIFSNPTRTLYNVGDEANYSGLSFFIRDEDRNIIIIQYDNDPDAFTITGFDSSAPSAEQTITVECRGYTDTFIISIEAPPPEKPVLESIRIDPLPKTTYKQGESLNLTGAYIIAKYADGSESEPIKLRMKHISGFDFDLAVGEHILTVKYNDDNGGYAETTFTITIN